MLEQEQEQLSEEDAKPLADWENPPKLTDLKQDLTEAKSTHSAQVTRIRDYLDALAGEGKSKVKVPKGNSAIVPKVIRKQAEWRYSALSEPFLSSEDIYNVRPVSFEDRKAAQQNEILLNNQFNTKIDKVKFIDEYVRTVVDEGTVIVQVGGEFDEVTEDEESPDVEYVANPALQPLHDQLAQMLQESPSEYATNVPEELKRAHELTVENGVPVEAVIKGYSSKPVTKTIKNAPTLTIRSFENTIIDPLCEGDLDKARFVIYTFPSSLSELKKDGKYKNLEHINPDSNSILGTPDHEMPGESNSFNFKDKPRQKFIVHEYWGYWDINNDGLVIPIVVAWVGDTIIRMEENPFPDRKLPFVTAHYLPVRKSIYGEPDGVLLEDNQRIIGAVTRGMIDILGKSANGQTGISKGLLDATNKRKFDSGQDYEFNPVADPRLGIFMHTYNEIPASGQYILQQQSLEAESMTGVKTFNQGISSQSLGDVAVGIRNALDAASKRELGILRRLASGITAIGRKIIAMNAEFLSEEEVVRVTNEEFVKVRRDDLPGNFDLRLSISTPEEDNNKAEQLAFMLQTVGPQEDPTVRRMILADVCRLRKMPDLAKKLENYEPEPDPLMQRKLQLEIELLESQVNENNARAQNYVANAQLENVKVTTEAAKAENIKSDTDLKNLDFVEQESGVKQERDLQKQGAQSQAQAQTKVIDHALNLERDKNKHQTDLIKEYIKQKNKKTSK